LKFYLFNPDTGVYFGEFVADEAPEPGSFPLSPLEMTTIAPPEGGRGHIMVFDSAAQCWEVRSLSEPIEPQPNVEVKIPQKSRHCYWGSLLIFIGFMLWIAALCDDNKSITVACGLSLMLGAVAYLSINERILVPSKNDGLLKCIELGCILFIVSSYALESYFHQIRYGNILINIVPPIVSVSMYVYILTTDKWNP
jgi:hypothetical protein